MSLPFDGKELNRVNTQILLMIHSFQHAAVDVIIDHLSFPQSEKDQMLIELNSLAQKKMDTLIAFLYTQFGLTPDILKPPDA